VNIITSANNFDQDRLEKESRSQDRYIGPIYASTCLHQYRIRGDDKSRERVFTTMKRLSVCR